MQEKINFINKSMKMKPRQFKYSWHPMDLKRKFTVVTSEAESKIPGKYATKNLEVFPAKNNRWLNPDACK